MKYFGGQFIYLAAYLLKMMAIINIPAIYLRPERVIQSASTWRRTLRLDTSCAAVNIILTIYNLSGSNL